MAKKAVLEVDPGMPPPAPDDREHGENGAPGAPPLVQPAGVVEAPEEWSAETLKTIVALPFMAAHIVARRQGPPDAWMPDDAELEVMTAPLLGMANRYAMLRALARFGDPVAFTAAVGTYTVAESRRIARWRVARVEEAFDGPEEDLPPEGLHVAAEAPGAASGPQFRNPRAAVPVRAWKPPNIAAE